MNKEQILEVLKYLPTPLVGGLCFKSRFEPLIRQECLDMFRDVFDLSQPKEILEFGTHAGGSSLLMLALSNANVTSVDLVNGSGHIELDYSYLDYNVPGQQGGIKQIIYVFDKIFPGRFRFIGGSSYAPETYEQYKNTKYDICLVDGDHSETGCRNDILNCLKLGIKYLLVDDYTSSEDIRKACQNDDLELVKIYENIHNVAQIGISLFKNKNV